jgi:DedD protein
MQKETAGDLELNIKKRARRRLVGAIALVLMMLVLLPMLLKDRIETTPAEDVTINLSNDTAPAKSKTPDEFDSIIVPSIVPSNESVNEAKPTEAKSDKNNHNEQKQAPEATIVDTEAEPVKVPESAPVIAAEPPKTANNEPAKEAAAVKSTNKFYVQVGVFSDIENVKKLQIKLADLGYKSQTDKVNTPKGEKIRLRTHTFSERNEAAIALQNIQDAGLTGMVVSQ